MPNKLCLKINTEKANTEILNFHTFCVLKCLKSIKRYLLNDR